MGGEVGWGSLSSTETCCDSSLKMPQQGHSNNGSQVVLVEKDLQDLSLARHSLKWNG